MTLYKNTKAMARSLDSDTDVLDIFIGVLKKDTRMSQKVIPFSLVQE